MLCVRNATPGSIVQVVGGNAQQKQTRSRAAAAATAQILKRFQERGCSLICSVYASGVHEDRFYTVMEVRRGMHATANSM